VGDTEPPGHELLHARGRTWAELIGVRQYLEQSRKATEREVHSRRDGPPRCVLIIHPPPESQADRAGYGASDKPKGSESHVEYSKREMANDQVQVM
jgi:hypothetical protein